ncbi:MAG: hypothetical protein LQ343_005956 [Gyalolechia ehrenbergii]|nr:MAG: hypothetical protein LQ343_005956 [Gyalolechia ehrenbergii]
MATDTASLDQPGFDLYANQQGRIIATSAALIILTAVFVLLRLLSRRLSRAGLWWDDLLAVIALAFCIVTCSLNFIQVHNGFGRHIYIYGEQDAIARTRQWLRTLYVFEPMYHTSTTFAKYSILAFYYRIFAILQFRRVLYLIAAVVTCYIIPVNLLCIFQCTPVHSFWDVEVPRHCVNIDRLFIASGSLNVVLDFIIFALPMPLLWRLGTSFNQKLILTAIFTVAGFLITGNYINGGIWAETEPSVAVICACLPSLRPLFAITSRSLAHLFPRQLSLNKDSSGSGKWLKGEGIKGRNNDHDDFSRLEEMEEPGGLGNDVAVIGGVEGKGMEMGEVPARGIKVETEVVLISSERLDYKDRGSTAMQMRTTTSHKEKLGKREPKRQRSPYPWCFFPYQVDPFAVPGNTEATRANLLNRRQLYDGDLLDCWKLAQTLGGAALRRPTWICNVILAPEVPQTVSSDLIERGGYDHASMLFVCRSNPCTFPSDVGNAFYASLSPQAHCSNTTKMRVWKRYRDVVAVTWHLGVTAFGGPAVQFQTFHKLFVEDHAWIDEARYQQIFAICQALPGSASAKMLFCINAVRGGLGAAFLASAFFCVPGAIGMYALSIGISHVGDTLPDPVYALLSGLNAATVGIIALAGVSLASRAITDALTRILVFLGGALGMLYTALWYYPVIMAGAGLTTMIWDLRWPHTTTQYLLWLCRRLRSTRSKEDLSVPDAETGFSSWPATTSGVSSLNKPLPPPPHNSKTSKASSVTVTEVPETQSRSVPAPLSKFAIMPSETPPHHTTASQTSAFPTLLSLKLGSSILALFTLSFLTIILLPILLPAHTLPRPFSLFSSLYLAGTIIFGGGPVVIPLLREYIVSPGWVSPRDFLLGLAIIQSFPGPNFNFAVYLGALATKGTTTPSFVGALIAFLAIFVPGMVIVLGFLGVWVRLQKQGWFRAVLRGVNAAAVGLVFTAVYKLWEIGLVGGGGGGGGRGGGHGMPLGGDPWLVAVTAGAFVGGAWFKVSAPVAILAGGVAGVGRWAVFHR